MNICVFSSSSNAVDSVYFDEAERLGRIIGERNHNLVNGGANVGLMEAAARAAFEAGSEIIGIIPERFIKRSLASDYITRIIITADMQERKARMRELSDAFIALPGGFGTLEEIMEVITLKQLSYHSKPVVFINSNNFFRFLFSQFELFFNDMFTKEIYRDIYFVASDSFEALDYIENYKVSGNGGKWYKVPEK
jgi:cytokinin riboside 5'-monophosphate phosphoribohydrolase